MPGSYEPVSALVGVFSRRRYRRRITIYQPPETFGLRPGESLEI
jgi:hypothetical protein